MNEICIVRRNEGNLSYLKYSDCGKRRDQWINQITNQDTPPQVRIIGIPADTMALQQQKTHTNYDFVIKNLLAGGECLENIEI